MPNGLHRFIAVKKYTEAAVTAFLLSQLFVLFPVVTFFYCTCSISVLVFIRTASKWPMIVATIASTGIEVNPRFKAIRIFLILCAWRFSKYLLIHTQYSLIRLHIITLQFSFCTSLIQYWSGYTRRLYDVTTKSSCVIALSAS